MKRLIHRTLLAALTAGILLGAGLLAANKFGKPKTVVHVVTVKWKEGVTTDQIRSATEAVEKLAGAYPGIRNVWTRAIKVQGQGYTHAFVMEFESEESLKKYADSDAQKEFYKVYIPLRGESTTHDITN